MSIIKSHRLVLFLALLLGGLLSLPFDAVMSAAASDESVMQANSEDSSEDALHSDEDNSGRGGDEAREGDGEREDDEMENEDEEDDDDRRRGRDEGAQQGAEAELQGPIEALSPSTGTPNQLTLYGIALNLGGAEIELESHSLGIELLDLAPTQFVKVKLNGTNARKVEVSEGEAEGLLQNLATFATPSLIPVNRNSRTIEATFTVGGAGILCDNAITRVQASEQAGTCDLLSHLTNREVEVEGLVVVNFNRSLTDLTATVPPRNVILATRVRPD